MGYMKVSQFPITCINILVFLFWSILTVITVGFGDLIYTEIKGLTHVCLIYLFATIPTGIVDYLLTAKEFKMCLNKIRHLHSFEERMSDAEPLIPEFEEYNIIVTSLRLDNFVAELANCSRTNASDMIIEGRVFVNSINEFKDSKKINIGDLITKINMPVKYVLYFSNEFNCKNICTDGWIDIETLTNFEKHTKKLIETFKKCLVEQRKYFLEKDFD